MNDSAASTVASNVGEYSVSELSGAIKRTMEDTYGRVRVRGELGRVSRPASGHIYLDLKDDRSVLAAVIWKGAAAKMPIQPEEGLEVIATGKITTFPGQSKYQLVIDALEPAGAGALMALLEERKKRLAAEGLFDEARKRPLPFMPTVIGVVTSPTGAVIRDILHRIADRYPLHVIVWPVRVQGETSAQEVARAIDGFNALDGTQMIARPDLLIVARGGGSLEDLWGFNEEIVARAAANSAIPLISAIGHETDTTLIDYASDRRAPTPTGAAEMAVPVKADLEAQVAQLGARLRAAISRSMDRKRDTLRSAARAIGQPDALLALPRQQLDNAGVRLGSSLTGLVAAKRNQLAVRASALTPARLSEKTRVSALRLNQSGAALPRALDRRIETDRARLTRLAAALNLPALQTRQMAAARSLGQAASRLDLALANRFTKYNAKLLDSGRMLRTLSHKSVLARGFALVRDADGKPVRQSSGVKTGQMLTIEFADDDILSVQSAGAGATLRRAGAKEPKTAAKPGGQGTLL